MSKTPQRQPVVMPTVEEDRRINAAARADPDALPLTPKQLQAMVPMKALPAFASGFEIRHNLWAVTNRNQEFFVD